MRSLKCMLGKHEPFTETILGQPDAGPYWQDMAYTHTLCSKCGQVLGGYVHKKRLGHSSLGPQ